MESLNNNDTPFKIKVQIYGATVFILFFFPFFLFPFIRKFHLHTDGRASRKCHRKTLLYISGLGMMIFIFIAAILVRNMEGFSSTHSFLDAPRSTANQTKDPIEATENGSHLEISLLISILCYNSFCALGVIILPWTLISELYPIQVRT